MKLLHLYKFPLFKPVVKNMYRTSFFDNGQDLFGFVIKSLLYPSQSVSPTPFSLFQFFEVDALTETVAHRTIFLPHTIVQEMELGFDHVRNEWYLVVDDGAHPIYKIAIANASSRDVQYLYPTDENIGLGNKYLVSIYQQKQQTNVIFAVSDLSETQAPALYWAHLNDTQKQWKHIGSYDVIAPYLTEKNCILFSCQRIFSRGKESLQQVAEWCFVIETFTFQGELVKQEVLADTVIPIRDVRIPADDFFHSLSCRINVADGPVDHAGVSTCIAALVLEDGAQKDSNGNLLQKGGLYWLNDQGNILQHLYGNLGSNLSLCLCQDIVIGADSLYGVKRLWSWMPTRQHGCIMQKELSPYIRRVTVLSTSSACLDTSSQFWCVEEYADSLIISCWESTSLQELASIRCEGITLLETSRPGLVKHKQA